MLLLLLLLLLPTRSPITDNTLTLIPPYNITKIKLVEVTYMGY